MARATQPPQQPGHLPEELHWIVPLACSQPHHTYMKPTPPSSPHEPCRTCPPQHTLAGSFWQARFVLAGRTSHLLSAHEVCPLTLSSDSHRSHPISLCWDLSQVASLGTDLQASARGLSPRTLTTTCNHVSDLFALSLPSRALLYLGTQNLPL